MSGTRAYDFTTGIETASAPTTSAPSGLGDVITLGSTTQFTIADATGPANVTNIVFLKTVYRAFEISYCLYRSAAGGSTRAQYGKLFCVTDGTNWEIYDTSVSVPNTDDAGVDFTITSGGQVQYTSDSNGGSYLAANSYMKWELVQLIAI
jgi:hypothetical protein